MEDQKNGARFQQEQPVSDSADTKAETGDTSYVVTETKRSGGKLKQEVAAQVVNQGKGTSGIDSLASPSAYGKIAGSYTGDGKAVLGNFANTPILDKSHQGTSREDKKLSDPNKDINLMASEQYATYFEQPKALAVDREATVGYNGNPSNISARAQKNSGFSPAELTYDRSVDEIRKDQVIFVSGQVLKANAADDGSYPTKTFIDANGQASVNGITWSNGQVRGNFMPRAIKASFTKGNNGVYLSAFAVEEDDLNLASSVDLTHDVINDSSACHVIDVNRAEIYRQAIDNDHGSPTSPKYNPLGRSVAQPSKTMLYLMDIENVSGAIMASSIRHALKQRCYYLTRVGKDGINEIAPAIDALYGHIAGWNGSNSVMNNFTASGDCPYDNTSLNAKGSAMVLVHVFDSEKKFKTKADIVNQPRGLKLPLQTGLSNHTPFHVSEDFIRALNAIDVFSTIDRSYDPSAPTCISDGLAYVLPYSWKKALSFTREGVGSPRVYSSSLFSYRYQAGNGNQSYYIKVGEPVLNGIAWFLEQYASSIYSAIGSGNGNGTRTLTIPIRSYTTSFSLWDYLVCASSAYILYERTNSLKDILDEEEHSGYPFKHMINVSKEVITNPTNYGPLSMFDRIQVKEMLPSSAMKWIMPELFMPMGSYHLAPWYNSESDFTFTSDEAGYQNATPHNMPAPVIRSGVAMSYLDDFYGMSLKDQLLSIDRMTTLPGRARGDVEYLRMYKYGQDSAGIPIISLASKTAADFLKAPRQMGWSMDAPEGVCRIPQWVTNAATGADWFALADADFLPSLKIDHSSFIARVYSGMSKNAPNGILNAEVVAIGRGQAFAQKWTQYYASHKSTDGSNDMVFSMASALTRDGDDIKAVINKTMFKPVVKKNMAVDSDFLPMFAMMRALWTRIQKLPFIINPFDAGSTADNIGIIDPFDFAYMFGLAGFMEVTYFEELSNRMSDKYAKMFNFTEDPFVADSPLYK